MANTVTIRHLNNQKHGGTVHVYMASDGAAGEETDTVLLDSSTLTGGLAIKRIEKISSSLVGFNAVIEFDQTSDSPAAVLTEGTEVQCFKNHPINNPAGSGTTGDVTITTSGFTATGDQGTIIIEYRK